MPRAIVAGTPIRSGAGLPCSCIGPAARRGAPHPGAPEHRFCPERRRGVLQKGNPTDAMDVWENHDAA